jgi:iron complex transport system ATP-binding protein
MIAISGISLAFGPRTLLEDVTFEAGCGELIAVMGANGAGKTTLLRTIAGAHAPSAGCVLLDGRDLREMPAAARARAIARVESDEVFLDRLSVRDVVSSGRYPHHRWWQWHEEPEDEAAVTAALNAVGMRSFADRAFETLSSGERQRVWIALAIAQESRVLVLDEPTSHLDVRVAHEILSLLRAQVGAGKAAICALHDVNEAAAYAGRIALLAEGRLLAFGPPSAVLTPRLLERAYGIPMDVLRSNGTLRAFPAVTTDRALPEALVHECPRS